VVRLTAEVIGYLLSGANQAKAFFVIGTAPDSGKSTLALLISKLIGEEYTCSIEPNKLHERFSLGSTRGKILNMAMDIPQGRLCSAAVSKIKAITGRDSISIEEKYMRMEHTVSSLRFLFGTNHPINLAQTDADDDAFWNRMHVIPFMRSVSPDERDPMLLDKLWAERDAIVSFCLKRYQTVLNNGYVFSPCQASEDMKASWRRDDVSTVSFASFWQDYVEVTGDPDDQIYSQVLYEKYSYYCQDRGIDPVFYTKMKEWIEAHTDPDMCVTKRLHRTGQNPRAGYFGIKVHY
jgi:putative DNA primase/helicase